MVNMNELAGPAALIAGGGALPAEVARGMAASGLDLTVYTFGSDDGGRIFPVGPERVVPLLSLPGAGGRLSLRALAADLRTRGIPRVTLAGLVPKTVMYGAGADETLMSVVTGGANDDHGLLGRIVTLFETFGFTVLPYDNFVKDSLAPMGPVSGRAPSEGEREDCKYGQTILSVTLPLSFGQSVVVARGAVVAVEAMEGTDEMIRRAGKILGGVPGVVVKMMRPDQDVRFDIPVVGTETLGLMAKAGLTALFLEGGRTIIVEKEAFVSLADDLSIAVEGIAP